MSINISDVMSVYKKTGGMIDDAGSESAATGASGGGSFADALKNFAEDKISSLQQGEKAATAAVSGKADLASVVTAIDGAEIALTEVTTIRDKVITAYQAVTSSAI